MMMAEIKLYNKVFFQQRLVKLFAMTRLQLGLTMTHAIGQEYNI